MPQSDVEITVLQPPRLASETHLDTHCSGYISVSAGMGKEQRMVVKKRGGFSSLRPLLLTVSPGPKEGREAAPEGPPAGNSRQDGNTGDFLKLEGNFNGKEKGHQNLFS